MLYPVILAGGSGTRLWPLSRRFKPKQFIAFENNLSLFQETILRIPDCEDPIIVCNQNHRFHVSDQLQEIKKTSNGVILEPFSKNTTAAITVSAIRALDLCEESVLLILSSDHLIGDIKQFHNSIKLGYELALDNKLVAFGAHPENPETGYGYINCEPDNKENFSKIKKFIEKPDLKHAKVFCNSKDFFWNCGIFMFKADFFIDQIKNYERLIYENCKDAYAKSIIDGSFYMLNEESYSLNKNISIDYALMERTSEACMVKLNTQWQDVGSWESFWKSKHKNKDLNYLQGNIYTQNVQDSLIYGSKKLIAASDLEDILVIDTDDALLVARKSESQNIKSIVENLSIENKDELLFHSRVTRPWGYFQTLDFAEGYKVKRLIINSMSKISLQKHNFRSEHWVVIRGEASVTLEKEIFKLSQNESIFIPIGKIHRLENKTNEILEIIEVQTGMRVDEDDIERLEDDYQRI